MKLQEAIARNLSTAVGVNYDAVTSDVQNVYLLRAKSIIEILRDFYRGNATLSECEKLDRMIAEEHLP